MNDPRYLQQPYYGNSITWIDEGESGALRYPVSAGNSVALFDKHESRFFIKSVDISGMPLPLREFKYEEVIRKDENKTDSADPLYATKEDLDDFQAAVLTKVDELLQKYMNNKKHYDKNNKGD